VAEILLAAVEEKSNEVSEELRVVGYGWRWLGSL
jgi:hypothetical protein